MCCVSVLEFVRPSVSLPLYMLVSVSVCARVSAFVSLFVSCVCVCVVPLSRKALTPPRFAMTFEDFDVPPEQPITVPSPVRSLTGMGLAPPASAQPRLPSRGHTSASLIDAFSGSESDGSEDDILFKLQAAQGQRGAAHVLGRAYVRASLQCPG